ncbi:MAG TPA: hypothetical protein VFR97_04985 [Capillimicrobium sp.]|nr:hypothetical protein [Capillimicrobium sp.]
MPGLSSDPKKAQRQLDALARGRRTQAERLLASLGDAPAQPGHTPPEPRQKPGRPGIGELQTYPDLPPDPDPEDTHGREEDLLPEPEPEPRRRGGFLGGFLHGLD